MPQNGSSPLWRPAGTVGCLCLRVLQLVLAVATLAVMAFSACELTSDHRCRPWYYIAPAGLLQCVWSLPMALLDGQMLLACRCWHYQRWTLLLVTVADGITTAAVFTAASCSLGLASAASALAHAEWPHGTRFQAVAMMGFLSSAALNTSFFINLANLGYHSQLQLQN